MKKNIIIISLLLSAFCFLSAGELFAQKQKTDTQTKVFTKNFIVNSKDLVEVNTNYTTVVFQEWDKNEVDFTTTITLKKATEKEMEKLLEGLDLTQKQFGKRVSYHLSLSYSGKKRGSCNLPDNYEINLLVKIPKDIFLDITTRYGNVELINAHNDFKANITYGNLFAENLLGNSNKIDIKYGNLDIDNLHGNNNRIIIRYGKFNMRKVSHLSMEANYAKGNVHEVEILKLDSKYCTIHFDIIKILNISSCYDKIFINKQIDEIEGTMRYGTLSISSLGKSCVFRSFSYSKINIDEVLESFTDITLLSSYSNILLNIPKNQSFMFDYNGRYTKFKNDDIRLNEAIFRAESSSVQMKGLYGKNQESGKTVKIEASYGTVSLFE